LINCWDDRKSEAGEEWEKSILEHLDSANIVICLLSSDFISSDYCTNVELKRAWKRREEEGIRIVPILLKPVLWQETIFHRLQIIPRDDQAILKHTGSRREEAFVKVAKEIERVINSFGLGEK
jgi:hypothetical protein